MDLFALIEAFAALSVAVDREMGVVDCKFSLPVGGVLTDLRLWCKMDTVLPLNVRRVVSSPAAVWAVSAWSG